MVSTSLEVDIAALVGEMEDQPCEGIDHWIVDEFHDDGPATHYGRVHCASCGLNVIKSYCAKFVRCVFTCPTSECACGASFPTHELVTILGPVKP